MKMSRVSSVCAAVFVAATVYACDTAPKAFPAGTESPEAAASIQELQKRIENLQFGPANQELATAAIEADPELSGDGVTRIRELMDHRYAERLKLFSVG